MQSGTEKRPGMGRQPDKRKEADAAEGQSERSNEAEAGTPESTTAGSYGILPCRPNEKESHSSKKKRNGITSDYNFTAGIQPSLLRANP